MIERKTGTYSLVKDGTRLVFRTAHHAADRGSVLHSGIYNREFSSMLVSFACAGIAYFILVMFYGKRPVFPVISGVFFVAAFPLFRTYVFRERLIETILNGQAAEAVLCRYGVRKKVLERFPFAQIAGIRIDTKKDEVVNRDGVAFVEKIAAQHHTVIPEFGEDMVFYSLKLLLADGTDRTIFAHTSMQDVIAVYDEMKEFLSI